MHKDETTPPTEERKQFVEHLERATETVRSWPLWKQTILGSVQLIPPASHTRPTGSLGGPHQGGENVIGH